MPVSKYSYWGVYVTCSISAWLVKLSKSIELLYLSFNATFRTIHICTSQYQIYPSYTNEICNQKVTKNSTYFNTLWTLLVYSDFIWPQDVCSYKWGGSSSRCTQIDLSFKWSPPATFSMYFFFCNSTTIHHSLDKTDLTTNFSDTWHSSISRYFTAMDRRVIIYIWGCVPASVWLLKSCSAKAALTTWQPLAISLCVSSCGQLAPGSI